MAEKFSEKIFDARLYFDRTTRVLHTAAVVIVMVYYLQGQLIENDWLFWPTILLAGAYDFLPFISKKFTWVMRSRPSMLAHYLFFFILAVFVVPVGNPIELIAFAIMAVSTYWLGTEGFLLGFIALSGSYVFAVAHQIGLTSDELPNLLTKILMMAVMGGLITRYTVKDRYERGQLEVATEEVEYERKRLQSLINSMADAVIATDGNGNIELYNGAALILLNTNDTINGQPLSRHLQLIDEEDKQIDLIEYARLESRIIQRDDLRFKNNEGELVNLYVDLAPIRTTYGEEGEGFIVLLRDITKEKTIEEQRDEFISIVSHELRTPLAITEANISTAMLPKLKDEKKRIKMIKQAHENIMFLSNLVNDITTLAHAERGDLDDDLETLSPYDIAQELDENYKKEAAKKKLELKLVIPKDLPQIRSNEHRLKEILQDFITNAIKYTDEGTVTIKLSHRNKYVRFAIIDSGIGISTTDRKHVFDKFYRSEDYRTRTHNGTGLGLYIAKKLSELIQAKVGVESKLNEGSTFYIDVPVAKKKAKNQWEENDS